MPYHSLPSTPPQTLVIAPGQSLWLGLKPGSTLQATRGRVAVHRSPQACGHAMYTPSPFLLQAGEPVHCNSEPQAAWVQLHNPTRSPAELVLVETVHAPAWWVAMWQRLRRALGYREPAPQDPRYGSAWPMAR